MISDDRRPSDRSEPESPGKGSGLFDNLFIWPWLTPVSSADISGVFFDHVARMMGGAPGSGSDQTTPRWITPNRVALELPTMRLRDFSTGSGAGRSTLICGPFALHGANVADFAPGHSVVERLLAEGCTRLFVTDWRSATPEMKDFTIDQYLADLNVAVDDVGEVDLIGICQGGWLALLYACRFPHKVGKLVIAGAPIDIEAAASDLSRFANNYPLATFEHLVRMGHGVLSGQRALHMWSTSIGSNDATAILQLPPDIDAATSADLMRRFHEWNECTVDLPGAYYLQVVRELYRDNSIVKGAFVALGRPVDIARLTAPLYLLAGRDDRVVAVRQLMSIVNKVGTAAADIVQSIVPGGHLSLFMGHETLAQQWTAIGRWLAGEARPVTRAGSESASAPPG